MAAHIPNKALGEEDLTEGLRVFARFSVLRHLGWAAIAGVALSSFALASASSARAQTTAAAASPKPTTATAKPASARTAAARLAVLGPLVKSYGSSSAPLKMEVFTDYQCPSCRNLFLGTLTQLIASDYITSGKVFLVHHDFPLQAHMYSGFAALWANAAASVGEFPAVELALYQNQDAWQANGDIAKYVASAMPSTDFKRVEAIVNACGTPAPQSAPNSGNPLANIPHPCTLDRVIAEDVELGYKIPVQATPTYVITYKGNKLPAGSGVVSWPILKQFFDSLLSQ